MLARLDIKLDTNGERIRTGQAGLFHGWLQAQLSAETAEYLHGSRMHPYSQHLFFDGENWVWRIQTLNAKAREEIILFLQEKAPAEIFLTHSQDSYKILGMSRTEMPYGKLFEKNYLDAANGGTITFNIRTPMAFKSGGRYVRFPEPHYVFGSLLSRFDKYAGTMILDDPKVMEQVDTQINVGNYRISSSAFPLEGVRIPAFRGEITFCPKGGRQFSSMLRMLVDFAEYAGIGIKTSMGMGAVTQTEERGYSGDGSKN